MKNFLSNLRHLSEFFGRVNGLEEKQQDAGERLGRLEENIRNNNEQLAHLYETDKLVCEMEKLLHELESRQQGAEERLQGTEQDLNRRVSVLEENTRNNNAEIERLKAKGDSGQLTARVDALKQRIERLQAAGSAGAGGATAGEQVAYNATGDIPVSTQAVTAASAQAATAQAPASAYGEIDYFDFENHFRGSREVIKARQTEYLPYFTGCHKVVDLGCGRGEFLEMLQDNGIQAQGVDFYDEFVLYCKNRGLDAVESDAIAYLDDIEETDGIFAGQLVEHLSMGQIIALCEKAHEKLTEGGYMILETPNPMSLAIYTHAFYMDPSHQKPVHPYTLQYIVEKAGFSKVDILFTQGSRPDETIPQLTGTGSPNEAEFNRNLQVMAEYLYGSQDYAIIARK